MSNRSGLVLLLLLCWTPLASAQRVPPPPPRQSHHDLPGELESGDPQEMLTNRLRELHQLHDLQDRIQDLMRDPEFTQQLKDEFTPQQLRQLQEKLLKGQGLSQDKTWNQFLQRAAKGQKLNEGQIDLLRRWAERAQTTSPDGPTLLDGKTPQQTSPPVLSGSKPIPTPATPANSADSPEPSMLDRMQENTGDWIADQLEHLGGDVLDSLTDLGASEKDAALAEFLRNVRQPDLPDTGINETATALTPYLPKIGEFLSQQSGTWEGTRSLFRNLPSPSLPHGSADALASASSGSGEGLIGVLALLLVATIAYLLWRLSERRKASKESVRGENWHLGTWPVAPGGISTRQELIRAFEYLVLRAFGPSAGTCHHRLLAERLVECDPENAAHRQAAEALSWLYEQARYAPPDQPLSSDELSDARHALTLLAGATHA